MTRHQTIEISGQPRAVVVGAGLGGLAASMRLGAKGWRVTVIDRLDMPGGRGTSITSQGHRFDLGPTIVTAPKVFRDLFAACGRDFDAAVKTVPLDPFYRITWPDGSHLDTFAGDRAMEDEVRRLSPGDVTGWRKFLEDSRKRYVVGYEGMLTEPMHKLWSTLKVLPSFARLRADQSILSLARSRVKDERLRMALS
ncbi:MAG: NAD(P)-binding protein, partial [Pseudomonadota bacterium]